ncbi:hypothetical protein RSOLAG22IIIB_04619 [Rhizoctonia solani]|uniref:Cyclin N-terminal domain-containing protein n=1 Tax=Rhizoctonia solani TaxID=456999 RepID=A0A0K6FZ54_9AGAM|nr:hypothetical protein RSOLAG22IIIB_04619 [Rhizoctonia solani]
MNSSSAYTYNTTLTPIIPTTINTMIKSTRNALARLKKATKREVGGPLVPTTKSGWLGLFSTRCGSKAVKSQSTPIKTSAKFGQPQRDPHPDPYYGHKRTATMGARFIHDLFKCSSSFSPGGIPDDTYPTLAKFISYALSRSECDLDVHFYAMHLIWRMHIKNPELRVYHSHETYLAALMLATKQVVPEHYASESWTEVGQSIYSLERLASNEQRFCEMLRWELEVDPTLVEMVEEQMEMKYGEPLDYTATPMVSPDSDDSDDSSSVFSVDTPDTTPLPSDSDSSIRLKPAGECIWW